jgi:copper oxidase (laccase) domain-containing protein
MQEQLIEDKIGPWRCLCFAPWLQSNKAHGFLGKDCDFSRETRPAYRQRFLAQLRYKDLFLLAQTHSSEICVLETRKACEDYALNAGRGAVSAADGWIVPWEIDALGLAFGILTADCVPLLVRYGDFAAVLHAGWRGLAAGIIEKAFKVLSTLNAKAQAVQVLIPELDLSFIH